ncbi:hypothetical protein L2Y96_12225 [Luteibacter aegosomaticola]|uniref:hypothetical protein n=1 Tax=Luteibacter aegosomaticola TaxID=2911538 RepID=UPI001FF881C2|nr:hypothetical protein [Luteibacter aegosomaticola]UPG88186.1 hypothetical protein L2Y96_12225 [Luteibacter aegosomaticola]
MPDPEIYYANYAEYSKTFRAWMVAYGIGGPVVFLTNDKVAKAIGDSGHARGIVFFFLGGVILQVAGALINKWAAWYMYRGVEDEAFKSNCWYKVWAWVNNQAWLDVAIDVLALLSFACGTWLLLGVFSSALDPPPH